MNKRTIIEETYLSMLNNETKENRLEFLKKFYIDKKDITKADIIDLFNIAFIDEFLAEFNYFASWNLSVTEGKADFDPEFKQHEGEERDHRYQITERLREMGAQVPTKLLQEFFTLNSNGEDWKQELSQNSNDILLNRYNEELGAIEFYALFFRILRRLRDDERDTTSEMLVKKLKADEETHAKDLKDLLIENGILTTDLTNNMSNEEDEEEATEEDEEGEEGDGEDGDGEEASEDGEESDGEEASEDDEEKITEDDE